ncbi:MAG: cytochrome C [Deltaproteobacteria bacterium]|nr:MAG: cytochrome C [Deltaproteobacteria bacterium]
MTMRGSHGSAVAALGTVLALVLASPAQAQPGEVEGCMDCHSDSEDSLELGDGTEVSVSISEEHWKKNVHAGEIGCTDCHTAISDYPHPDVEAKDLRDYQINRAETCKRCHYAHFTRVADSIHYKQFEEGNRNAPTCVDCHGAHDIAVPGEPRMAVDERCAQCHAEISDAYRRSVHGKALLESNNPDVPVCTDCHGSHQIKDPRNADFHAASYQICAKCHSDADRMERYGLNPDVVDTYLDDFHGASNALYAEGLGRPDKKLATCTSCHGIHDIPSFKEADKSVVRARVLKTCRECHEEVPDGFQDAWLSHYPPTLSEAPLVWLVKWFYRVVIPLIMLGLVLHILMHLWRFRFRRPGGHR